MPWNDGDESKQILVFDEQKKNIIASKLEKKNLIHFRE